MTAIKRRKFLAGATSFSGLAACGGGGSDATPMPPAPTPAPPAPSPAPTPAPPAPAPPPAPPAPTPPPPAPAPPAPPPAPGPLPAWVSALPLWQWSEIPGTSLASVEPVPRPPGITGPRSKIDAWCGATLQRRGSVYMLGAAGGHADYGGNEVNALALNVESPRWTQLRAPTPAAEIVDRAQFYLDKRAAASHTYYSTQFIEATQRMVIVGNPGVNAASIFTPPPAGYPYQGSDLTASFDLSRNDWDAPELFAAFPGRGDMTACLCVKHSRTDDIYYSRNYGDGWYRWTAADNRWERLSATTRGPWYSGAAIDPIRSRMLVIGGYTAAVPAVFGLSGIDAKVQFEGLGSSALTVAGYPAVVYDEVLDRFLTFHNTEGRVRVHTVHPETWFVALAPIKGAEPVARPNGLHNAPQYVPELRGVVLANSYSGNVLFMRTSN